MGMGPYASEKRQDSHGSVAAALVVSACYCFQHVAIKNDQRQQSMNCVSVESGRNNRHKVKRWYSEDALPAMSHCTNPGHLASLDQGPPEPPLIPVEISGSLAGLVATVLHDFYCPLSYARLV